MKLKMISLNFKKNFSLQNKNHLLLWRSRSMRKGMLSQSKVQAIDSFSGYFIQFDYLSTISSNSQIGTEHSPINCWWNMDTFEALFGSTSYYLLLMPEAPTIPRSQTPEAVQIATTLVETVDDCTCNAIYLHTYSWYTSQNHPHQHP